MVTFTLKDAGDGTLLTVVESGFAQFPLERRPEAFSMRTQGWGIQLGNVQCNAMPVRPDPALPGLEIAPVFSRWATRRACA